MFEPLEERSWPGQHLGQSVRLYDCVSSTNDLARDCDEPGTVFIAREQIAGRGQHGRVWQSELGSSLLMSVSLNPPLELRRPVLLTAWASVAIADAIFHLTGVQSRLKWPNDLLVNGKKVCGILIEQARSVVLGLGLNLTQSAEEFHQAQLPDATSLYLQSGRMISPLTAAEIVVQHLDAEYARLLLGERAALESDWRWRIGLVGQTVALERLDGSIQVGRLKTLQFDQIELTLAEGGVIQAAPETIRHITAG